MLLHLLHAQQASTEFRLSALHVHHGLSPNADAWAAFCETLCRRLELALRVERVVVPRGSGLGVEASARQARYEAFSRCGADYLALAHHRDDQAETLLLNLLRGCGVQGAAAMPAVRELMPGGPMLLRPLLEVARADLLAWARQENLAWIEDESNEDIGYSRNFLRHVILPPLRERFPGSDAALVRASGHFAEAAGLLAELADGDLANARNGNGLHIPSLAALSPARARNLLRRWLGNHGLAMPDSVRLDELLRQMMTAAADAGPVMTLAPGLDLRRYRGSLFVVPACAAPEALSWRGEGKLPWANGDITFHRVPGQGIREDRIKGGNWHLAARRGGESLQLHPGRSARPLKKLLQEAAIPPWERDCLPCLWCGGDLVWVDRIGMAAGWQSAPDGVGILPSWHPRYQPAAPARTPDGS